MAMEAAVVVRESAWEIQVEDIIAAGLPPTEARDFYSALLSAIDSGRRVGMEAEVWRAVVEARLLRPDHPHALHQLVYYSVYAKWDLTERGPPPYWFPSSSFVKAGLFPVKRISSTYMRMKQVSVPVPEQDPRFPVAAKQEI